MDRADARHLLRRTAFAVKSEQVTEISGLDRYEAIDMLMDFGANPASTPPPGALDLEGKRWEQHRNLVLWWLERMRTVPRPLQEKLALFWHGHFATSAEDAYYAVHTWDQNQLFRNHGLGDYRSLSHQMAVGPAMLSYLDNYRNKAGNPNENFARELLELHLLGVGNYTENDIVETARAWTGHMLDDERTVYQFDPYYHDYRNKTIFGITRDWDGPQVIDEILQGSKKQTAARHLVKAMFEFFAYPDPADAVVDRFAAEFLAGGLQVWVLLRAILRSDEFWSEEARIAQVRTPVDFVVQCLWGTGSSADEARPDWWLESMGMALFYPPNPSGWGANEDWVSSSASWAKADFVRHLAWKAVKREHLIEIESIGAPQAVELVLSFFGIEDAAPRTKAALENYLYAERATWEWPQHTNLLTLTMLSPDIQVA
ncbi:MAG: DUF1800 domain-containing protein [Actinomycetia bacterium]|nr:DUF1800 domain-containing protein [Actinomycetes bacterium]MCP4959894.1 DUF1800 domain-containing protein [Actinomycetes bacterium]